MTRWPTLCALLALLLATSGAARGADELAVSFVSPPVGVPLFGAVEIEVEVRGAPIDAIASVEFFVDGLFVDRVDRPPFRIDHDLGDGNTSHRLEALATAHDGGRGEALLVSPAIRVDEAVDAALQQLYVTAERDGRRVDDLRRDELIVLDDGVPQRLVTFERGEVPMTAIVLVDASESMRGPRLRAATDGARAFVDAMAELDEAKLVLFADRMLHASPFTGFGEVLTTGLGAARAGGATALNDHLYTALHELEERQGRRVLILLSDGVDVSSILSMEQVRRAASRSRALIYWLRLGGAPDASQRFYSMWRGAEEHAEELELLERTVLATGGRIVDLGDTDRAGDAFAAVLAELRDQYVLGFYPSHDRGDGSWHEVEVRSLRRGVTLRTRAGYRDD
ncbi:MAG: VWA domain-containing protein [Acidobacteriota bacterium]